MQRGFGQYTMPTGIDVSASVNACSGTLYDNNVLSDYSNNQKSKFILCPDQPDKSIQVNFSSFNIEPGFDSLVIVNRDDYTGQAFTEPNVIGVYWGTNNPGTITSTHSSGCLTFYFSSDGSINRPGFSCDISCVEGCSPPEAVCSDYSVAVDDNGSASITINDIDGGSSASCGLQSITISEQNFDCNDLGDNTVTLTAIDINGNSDDCTATVTVALTDGLPDGWTATDLGGSSGTYNFNPCAPVNGEYTITSDGFPLLSKNTDPIAFASVPLCNNGGIQARVKRVDNGYAGLMIRESSAPGAKMSAIFSNLTNLLRRETRYETNGERSGGASYASFPFMLRLTREGNVIRGYYRNDNEWILFHQVELPMDACVEMGLAAFTYSPSGQVSATFDRVNYLSDVQALAMGSQPATTAPAALQKARVFPNPSSGSFTLDFERPLELEATAVLRNELGQAVQQQLLPAGATNHHFDGYSLPRGLYFLEVRDEQGYREVLKVVRQ